MEELKLYKFNDGDYEHWILANNLVQAIDYFVHDYCGEDESQFEYGFTINLVDNKTLDVEFEDEGEKTSWRKIMNECEVIPNCIGTNVD